MTHEEADARRYRHIKKYYQWSRMHDCELVVLRLPLGESLDRMSLDDAIDRDIARTEDGQP